MNYTRRDFIKTAAVGMPLVSLARTTAADPQEPNKSYYHGVQLGVQTYSFHEILNDGTNHTDWIIRDMLACGIYDCELFGGQVDMGVMTGKLPPASECPKPLHGCAPGKYGSMRNPWAWVFARYTGDERKAAREKERMWRETTSMDYFRDIRDKFNKAQINIFAYNAFVARDWTDLELDRTFEATKALGAKSLNVSTTFTIVKRMVPFAEKHQVIVAPHGHSMTWDPEEFSTAATYERAFALSKWVGANLDIGHYVASEEDPTEFINKYHDRITNIHLKDRKRNHPGMNLEDGANVPWGEGDTPIKDVLLLLQKKRYPIPAFIEYEHAGSAEPVEEVKKAYEYCEKCLSAS